MMMLQCWELSPDKRPTFKTLYMDTSKFIEEIAGYLELGFNPFVEQRSTAEEDNYMENMLPQVTII